MMIDGQWGRFSEVSKGGYSEDHDMGVIKIFPLGFRKIFCGDGGRIFSLRSLIGAAELDKGWLRDLFQKLDEIEKIARQSISPPEYRPFDYSWRDRLDLDEILVRELNQVLLFFLYQDPDPNTPFSPMVTGVFKDNVFSVKNHEWIN